MALHVGAGKGPAHLNRKTQGTGTAASTAGQPIGLLLLLTKAS